MTAHNLSVFIAGCLFGGFLAFAVAFAVIHFAVRKDPGHHPVQPVHPVNKSSAVIPESKFHNL